MDANFKISISTYQLWKKIISVLALILLYNSFRGLGDTSKLYLHHYDVKSWTPLPSHPPLNIMAKIGDSQNLDSVADIHVGHSIAICTDILRHKLKAYHYKGWFEVHAEISVMALTPSPP